MNHFHKLSLQENLKIVYLNFSGSTNYDLFINCAKERKIQIFKLFILETNLFNKNSLTFISQARRVIFVQINSVLTNKFFKNHLNQQ